MAAYFLKHYFMSDFTSRLYILFKTLHKSNYSGDESVYFAKSSDLSKTLKLSVISNENFEQQGRVMFFPLFIS